MKTTRERVWRFSLATAGMIIAGGCAGDGCGGCVQPTPGGFPPESRVANGAQLRLTPTAIDVLEANPEALVGYFLGTGQDIEVELPNVCVDDDPETDDGDGPFVCCTEEGAEPLTGPCGPIQIDDMDVTIDPVAGQSRVNITALAVVTSAADIPIEYFDANCDIRVHSTSGDLDDFRFELDLDLVQDATTGTTRIDVITAVLSDVEDDDIEILGNFVCDGADAFLKGYIIDQITGTVNDLVGDALEDQFCAPCTSGSVDECSAFADACEDEVCMRGGECDQELGLAGRLMAGTLLGGFSSGQLGAIDVYEVAGGYGTSEGEGISLGVLGGMLPAAAPRDRCGPPAEPPATVDIPVSSAFQGNTLPGTADPFGFGIGIHQHQLDLLSWAAYESGFACANIGTRTVDLLSSDTLSAVIRSLQSLTHGRTSQVVLGLRPQAPPVLKIGSNTFMDDGSGEMVIDEPLIDVTLDGAEIDLYMMVDDQYVRIMTIVADLHIPVGVEVDEDGALIPVLGDLENALSEVSVKNSEALAESPEELADILPTLVSVALPALGGAFDPIALPTLGPLSIKVQPAGVTSVDDDAFLAVFGDVDVSTAMAAAAPAAATEARVVSVRAPRDVDGVKPALELDLSGRGNGPLEYSFRVDQGTWSPYTRSTHVTLARAAFRLPGEHRVEVRAREVGKPRTTDRTPVVVTARLYDAFGEPARPGAHQPNAPTDPTLAFHGTGSSGCDCNAGGGSSGGLLFGLLALLGLRARSRARGRERARTVVVGICLLFVASMPACSCGGGATECAGADGECLEGEVERGPTGRWSSTAISDERLVVSAYEESLGDLVLIELDDEGEASYTVVDGLPPDTLPTYDGGYRDGVVQPGPDVGAYTSIVLRDDRALVAYHDLDAGSLKLAREDGDGDWHVSVVDDDEAGDAVIGQYASLAVGADGIPTIAYLAVGLSDGGDGLLSQLRFARASSAEPSSPDDWTVEVLDEEAIDPAPAFYDLPQGVGLFASNLAMPDGRGAVVYYNRTRGALRVAEQQGGWDVTRLDGGGDGDRGAWADALVDEAGTVHVAYQDAIGDQLLYTTWDGGEPGSIELIDDGVRGGETRTHPVGASASLFLDSSGALAVAYQDGATSDLVIARRASGSWTRDDLGSPLLDGFHVSAASRGGRSAVSSYQYDQAAPPPGVLEILVNP